MENQMSLVALVLDFLKFLLYCKIVHFLKDLFPYCSDILRLLFTIADEKRPNVSDNDGAKCRQCSCDDGIRNEENGDYLTEADARQVLKKLAMTDENGQECLFVHGLALVQEAELLLEEKEASMEELKEAFYVFDRNEDGYITADELWNVMRRLQIEEGSRIEDCRKMIDAYDEDGNGRICFREFKSMLECAT